MSVYSKMFLRDVQTVAEMSFAAFIVAIEFGAFFGVVHYAAS